MLVPREVDVPPSPLERLHPLIGEDRFAHLEAAAARTRALMGATAIWNVNSTDRGGGVAEMLQVLLGYSRGVGLDMRWLVVAGDAEFFAITKRIHNRLHGVKGDDGDLGTREVAHYRDVLAENASTILEWVRPGDVALLHDPQTVGLADGLRAAGVLCIWRCHVGVEHANRHTDQAWSFLRPFLEACDAHVFTRQAYVPPFLADAEVAVIPPSIDPFSPKNQELAPGDTVRILGHIGVLAPAGGDPSGSFTRRDGSVGHVVRRASLVAEGPPLSPDDPLVVQVSRWDHLKDMRGVLEGFASRVVGRHDAHLVLVGPAVDDVSDDPEGAQVLGECVAAWEGLPRSTRQRVRLVTLPMDDVDENAAMVNALQRHATVIVQKSLAEGFGLTVSEGMWKAKPVLASAVGGISDQIVPGTGVLLDDPADLDAYGDALGALLADRHETAAIGARAHRHVLDNFLGDRHLMQYAELLQRLVAR